MIKLRSPVGPVLTCPPRFTGMVHPVPCPTSKLDKAAFILGLPLFPASSSIRGRQRPPLFRTLFFLLFYASPTDPDILNGVYMSEALNPIFVDNFERDPTLTWQYFGSSTGFFRLYPGKRTETGFALSAQCK